MDDEFSKFPIHIVKKHGLHPGLVIVALMLIVGIYYHQSLPGAHAEFILGVIVRPVTHSEFILIAIISSALAVLSIFPIFIFKIDADESGITKTIAGNVHCIKWDEISDFCITGSQNPIFKGTLIQISINCDANNFKNRKLFLTPAKFGATPDEFMTFIREGVARWGQAAKPVEILM